MTWLTSNCNANIDVQYAHIDVMSNILNSKGKVTTKFGQLIEHNIKNIFLEKVYTKCGG